MNRIFPLNLTARAATRVAGNPATTRLESGVSNCFPGLEFDHRNLDRRFFPGMVFEFVTSTEARSGARFIAVQVNDPELQPTSSATAASPHETMRQQLLSKLSGDVGTTLASGAWFLQSITQAGKTIHVDGATAGARLDGTTIWRLVRSLEPGAVTIVLANRKRDAAEPHRITLEGWRRTYTNADTGVISSAYQPGELSQSLCSPWMHDFRDCACFYWASNHPDIVLAEPRPGETLPDGSPSNPVTAGTPIDWLRSDRSPDRAAAAAGTEDGNRPAQMDHYEINSRWQDLAIVLLGEETTRIFQPRAIETATAFASPNELADKLVELAALEHVVMLEYLYARYSVIVPDARTPQPLQDDATFVRHEMLLIAVSEMRHLRWVNQLLWELEHLNIIAKRGPILAVASKVPTATAERDRALRPLTAATLDDFIAVEQPSGGLDGEYARVLATLRDQRTYPEDLSELASRIIADGTQHFSRFRQIRVVLQTYFKTGSTTYLSNLTPAPKTDATAKAALDEYQKILDELRAAYIQGDAEDFNHIAIARSTMFALEDAGNKLAVRGLGIPFF